MSKQKAFKRKLKKPHCGFQYYRFWDWPQKPNLVGYHQENYGDDPNVVIENHPKFGWLRLHVEHYTPGCLWDRVSESRFNSYRLCSEPLNGTISDRYYRRRTQALRAPQEYVVGVRHDGLAEAVSYHETIDDFECWGTHE